jgi:micrococcal nuclease
MSLKHQVFKSSIIKEYGTDRYGRILGLAFADGTNVNLEMVKAGLAEVYRGKHAKGVKPKNLPNLKQSSLDQRRKK